MFFGEAFAVKLVFVKFGPVQLELLQPLDDKSIWANLSQKKAREFTMSLRCFQL
jgi:hypothetical protein